MNSVSSDKQSVEAGHIVDCDVGQLQSLGYKQEFRREFTRWSTLSYAISIMGVLGSVPATWSAPLAAGGPTTATWAWISGVFFSLCLGLSIGELVSAYPTSGGVYYVTKQVFPPDKVPLAAWIIGWSNFLGQTAGVASIGYSVAQMVCCYVRDVTRYSNDSLQILAAVSMASLTDDGTFSYSP